MSNAIFSEFPLVTVVVPTYNRLSLVQQAIDSVLGQTYGNWELIIVDDGSGDGTVKIIRSIPDSRILVLELPHCGNIAVLRNAGVKAGSGAWLAFLDSDDIWVPNKLELQLSMLQEGKRWGYGRYELINEKLQVIPNKEGKYRPLSGWITKEVLTCEASVNMGTLMVERSLFNEVGGFNTEVQLICREDYEFVLRLSLHAETVATPELLARIREHNGRTTSLFDDGNERTVFVYGHFMRTQHDAPLLKIARRQRAYEFTEIAIKRMKQRKYLPATLLLAKAFIQGDKWRHLLSAIRRGFNTSQGNNLELI
jgi:glycosyltransferase involved in cell wall biosynthesis